MNEDAILRQAHPLYDAFCQEEINYDTAGGQWDYECDKWESYDDMGR